ncbi:MAG TPA: anaerobic nitric oxide reductase flavorubredoxin [Bacillota bacterium]|nr:anaerobic nitric oxide reductase flavorubredoxin [Bacillota bacterium]
MSYKINNSVAWVGKKDWDLRTFHGEEYSTHRGSSYNAYLVRDQKVALIDTVWLPFAKEFVANLKEEIDLSEIDYIVVNHGEVDHSGALPELMREIPDTPIYCTKNAIRSLKGQYHQDWNFVEVKTGDKLSLGDKELTFIEARMLHWPDSMFTYLSDDGILFSNDAFGQHYASEFMFNDEVDQAELFQEAIKYYANILTPFSRFVVNKVDEFVKLNLPLNMICTSHGIIWRDNPMQIVEQYVEWANDYQENQITILFDTMWNGTKHMAHAIANGIRQVDPDVTVKLIHTGIRDKNDVLTEVFKSKAILVGSPTINGSVLSSIAAILDQIKGLGFKNKRAAAFGAYGWSGEGVKILNERLADSGMELVNDGLRSLWNPDEGEIEKCINLGKSFAKSCQ